MNFYPFCWPFWPPRGQNFGYAMFGHDWNHETWTPWGQKWGSRNKMRSQALIVWELCHFTYFHPFWGPFWPARGQNLGYAMFGHDWNHDKWTPWGKKWGTKNKNVVSSTYSLGITPFYLFSPFLGAILVPPGAKIWGMQCSDMSETTKNEFLGVGNRVVGTKIRSLALTVWKLHYFTHFFPFWGHFGPPGAKIWGM